MTPKQKQVASLLLIALMAFSIAYNYWHLGRLGFPDYIFGIGIVLFIVALVRDRRQR